MRFLRNFSLQQKQTLIILLTSGAALLLACAIFLAYDVMTFRRALVNNVSTLAQIVGSNSTGALDFDDPKSAEETLSALQAEPSIDAGCIYTKNGEIFAAYHRLDGAKAILPASPQPDGYAFRYRTLQLFRKIEHKGEFVGTVYVECDMEVLYSRLQHYAVTGAGIFALALLAAFFLSARLQKLISGPILHLVQTSRAVARQKNFSMRAVKQSQDELGVLVDSFNEMLSEIQFRDVELQKSKDVLEDRVRERTHELANSVSLLHATLESTADGILVTDGSGKISNFNDHFVRMWQIPRAVADSLDEQQMINGVLGQLKDPEKFLAKIKELNGHPEIESFDVLEFTDGKIFERYSKPQQVGDSYRGRVWSFRNITQRKQSEAELEVMHRQLVDASRQAGMADVATNVLHNVGNVLNSVNVSSSVIREKIHKSRGANISKVAALLKEHGSDLPAFFASDPKAKQLPDYLAQLGSHLANERQDVLREVVSLVNNIEHIKEIVTMQQSYAKVSGISETLQIVDLVEDALRMNVGGLERHQVKVVREYSTVPAVTTEKHKVMQILINLVRNAKYACEEAEGPDKHITMRVTQRDDKVQIAVIDNGVGIPQENLTRIFAHGFTTRKTGHGFGLHSGALAAREIGGSLKVHSDGPGRGAEFVLELPLGTQPQKN